jgi:NitT/TauT family transport system substrate-binding protein
MYACQEQPQRSSELREEIRVAYPTSILSVLFHVALDNGFFHEEGLVVTPQPHEFGRIALNSMLEGKADLAITADTPVMHAVTGGREITTIGVAMTSRRGSAIIARKDRGIVVPADLKGKTVGVARGTAGEYFLDSFLSTRGMDTDQLNILDMRPGEMLEGLLAGRADAVSIWDPLLIQLKRELGVNGIVFYDEAIYRYITCIAARPEFVRTRPEDVRKLLTALIRAENFIKDNPEASRRLAADFLKLDREVLEEIWASYDFRVVLDQSLIVSLEDQTRWAQQKGLTSRGEMPHYLDFIYFDGLLTVKPEAVRIIR